MGDTVTSCLGASDVSRDISMICALLKRHNQIVTPTSKIVARINMKSIVLSLCGLASKKDMRISANLGIPAILHISLYLEVYLHCAHSPQKPFRPRNQPDLHVRCDTFPKSLYPALKYKACTSRFCIRFGCTSASYVSSLHQNRMLITAEFWLSGIFRDNEPELYQINHLFIRSISVLQSSSGQLKI
uniref:Uncharacterized protein n=1 Tax=Candidatus Methanogaster sp. ANME-2c ERB4 TaxID=2759911 RepID=A0A7G9YRD5_9EURY|nr:hypothetical protein HGEBJNHG_00044 [Methanosarcinales archaeon ANME-2c ERB4]